jgi:hypothetical protein
LDHMAARLRAAAVVGAAHTFVFGHYPLATMRTARTADGEGVLGLLSSASVYACGHLHTLLGTKLNHAWHHAEIRSVGRL